MTQPTAEAYEAASSAWLYSDGGNKEAVRAVVDAVWPLAVAEGRRQVTDEIGGLAEWRDVHTGDVDAYERRLDGTYQPRDESAL